MNDSSLDRVVRIILKDIAVGLTYEFDKNFSRQAFFSKAWARRKSPIRPGRAILTDTGGLRRSLRHESTANSVTFMSDLPYAAIHNEGGRIRVTPRMKRFFWAKMYEAQGRFNFRRDGSLSQSKKQVQLNDEASFWKALAQKKVGDEIVIPERRFLGNSPEVEKLVRDVIRNALQEFFGNEFIKK